MTQQEQAYAEGFVNKCAEAGIDPEALVKKAGRGDMVKLMMTRGLQHIDPKVRDLAKRLYHGIEAKLPPDYSGAERKAISILPIRGDPMSSPIGEPMYAAHRAKELKARMWNSVSPRLHELNPHFDAIEANRRLFNIDPTMWGVHF